MYESEVEKFTIELLKAQGYKYLTPEEWEVERNGDLGKVVLEKRLREAVDSLNPDVPEEAREQAVKAVLDVSSGLPSGNLVEINEAFHKMLVDGVQVEYLNKEGETEGGASGGMRGGKVRLIDYEITNRNDLVVCNQYTVIHQPVGGNERTKRPDVVLFVNGLPLAVIELKNPTDEKATVKSAYTQLDNYKKAIAPLFYYNGILVASDGTDAQAGSLTSGWTRFMAWKTVDGVREDPKTVPQIETLIKGMLRPDVLLHLISHYTVFEREKREDSETGQVSMEITKKIAGYHQYHAIRKAVDSTITATSELGDRKAGVVWHTQGSGKSLSMVFYSGEIVLALSNPTLVVITDRNDLDDQLFETFGKAEGLLRQKPVQAESRTHLKELLQTAGGGIVFTTIQKFFPEGDLSEFEKLTDRKNVVVIADEAHRSQYGFKAKVRADEESGKADVSYGFAKYMRDALPNASFIGFTGTPIEKEDVNTPAVFGNYIDIYDIEQAVEDGATVRIYYESRLAKVHLKSEEKELLDAEVEEITENAAITEKEKAKARWTQLEAIVGHKDRLKTVAEDIVAHFEKRQEAQVGKAMIVTMSRRIAVELYEQIILLRPDWHDEDLKKGAIKVVMSAASSDDASWQKHHTTKSDRRLLGNRFKDEGDGLKMVIVRDMWLTGFDAPCLNTMYVDKAMRGHNLMQAIARVNRVFKDKTGGLVVDYIGIASDLKTALATYTESGGKGKPTFEVDDAVAELVERHEVVSQMLTGFDYKRFFATDTRNKMVIILEAEEFILGIEDGRKRFIDQVTALLKAFALVSSHKTAQDLKDDVGFFQAVKARLMKLAIGGDGDGGEVDIETAIRQIVDRAVVSEGVIDIFDAAGIQKPDISILSDEFLEEIKGMKHKNLASELLKKLLGDEIKSRERKNRTQSRKLSEMLENTIKKYQNNLLTAVQVIEELVELAKEIRAMDAKAAELGLTDYELSFYDALADNDSAKDVLGDEKLRELARNLVVQVRKSATIDWTIKESVQAKMRVLVKRMLNRYGYPPDMQKLATDNVLKQAELFAEEWGS